MSYLYSEETSGTPEAKQIFKESREYIDKNIDDIKDYNEKLAAAKFVVNGISSAWTQAANEEMESLIARHVPERLTIENFFNNKKHLHEAFTGPGGVVDENGEITLQSLSDHIYNDLVSMSANEPLLQGANKRAYGLALREHANEEAKEHLEHFQNAWNVYKTLPTGTEGEDLKTLILDDFDNVTKNLYSSNPFNFVKRARQRWLGIHDNEETIKWRNSEVRKIYTDKTKYGKAFADLVEVFEDLEKSVGGWQKNADGEWERGEESDSMYSYSELLVDLGIKIDNGTIPPNINLDDPKQETTEVNGVKVTTTSVKGTYIDLKDNKPKLYSNSATSYSKVEIDPPTAQEVSTGKDQFSNIVMNNYKGLWKAITADDATGSSDKNILNFYGIQTATIYNKIKSTGIVADDGAMWRIATDWVIRSLTDNGNINYNNGSPGRLPDIDTRIDAFDIFMQDFEDKVKQRVGGGDPSLEEWHALILSNKDFGKVVSTSPWGALYLGQDSYFDNPLEQRTRAIEIRNTLLLDIGTYTRPGRFGNVPGVSPSIDGILDRTSSVLGDNPDDTLIDGGIINGLATQFGFQDKSIRDKVLFYEALMTHQINQKIGTSFFEKNDDTYDHKFSSEQIKLLTEAGIDLSMYNINQIAVAGPSGINVTPGTSPGPSPSPSPAPGPGVGTSPAPVSYTHLRAHET